MNDAAEFLRRIGLTLTDTARGLLLAGLRLRDAEYEDEPRRLREALGEATRALEAIAERNQHTRYACVSLASGKRACSEEYCVDFKARAALEAIRKVTP